MADLIQRSFTGGEIAPSLRSRTDVNKYSTGLALCLNNIILPQGGIYSRPGTRFIGEVGDSSYGVRLIEFSFNTEQTYILVFGNYTLRVIKDGAFVVDGAGPAIYEIATPYSDVMVDDLNYTQDADVMTLVHPDVPPTNLSRLDHDDWLLETIDYSIGIDPPVWRIGFNVDIATMEVNDSFYNGLIFVECTVPHSLEVDQYYQIEFDGVTGNADIDALNDGAHTIKIFDTTGFQITSKQYPPSTDWGPITTGGNLLTLNSGALEPIGDVLSGGDYFKLYTYVISVVVDGVESTIDPDLKASIYLNTLSDTYGVKITWLEVANADYYRVYKEINPNTGIYGWIGDSEGLNFEDYNIAPLAAISPQEDNEPFTPSTDNNPSAVGYYQQRQIFANTNNKPQTFWASRIGQYDSMRSSSVIRDDDAIEFQIQARQVNHIRHIVDIDGLILLTSGAEWKITDGQDQVFTPSTVGSRVQSYNGVAKVRPEVVNDSVIFVQDKSNKLRDLKYQFADDKFSGSDLSVMASHLFEDSKIKDISYADEPYGIIWCVLEDGKLLGLTYQREHEVWAWHQHDTQGDFESIATISEDGRDATYVVVRRLVDGSYKRYVERFEPRVTTSSADVFCVDSGLSYDGVATDTLAGLDHLEGSSVDVVADGNQIGSILDDTLLVVSGGQIILPQPASKVTIGLTYTPRARLLDIDMVDNQLRSKKIAVSRVTLEVEKSRGGHVGIVNDDQTLGELVEIAPRDVTDNYDTLSLTTGQFETQVYPSWGQRGSIEIQQFSPFPLAILSVIPKIDVS